MGAPGHADHLPTWGSSAEQERWCPGRQLPDPCTPAGHTPPFLSLRQQRLCLSWDQATPAVTRRVASGVRPFPL